VSHRQFVIRNVIERHNGPLGLRGNDDYDVGSGR